MNLDILARFAAAIEEKLNAESRFFQFKTDLVHTGNFWPYELIVLEKQEKLYRGRPLKTPVLIYDHFNTIDSSFMECVRKAAFDTYFSDDEFRGIRLNTAVWADPVGKKIKVYIPLGIR